MKNNKASNKRQKITEAPPSNTEILRKSTETLMKEKKKDSEEDVFGKYVASDLKGLNMRQKDWQKMKLQTFLIVLPWSNLTMK